MTRYKVLVREGEVIYDGESLVEADNTLEAFMSQSKESDALVTLFQDSEIVRQCYRHLDR
jgi:hypothetical protein